MVALFLYISSNESPSITAKSTAKRMLEYPTTPIILEQLRLYAHASKITGI
jgi:hypothetical protein